MKRSTALVLGASGSVGGAIAEALAGRGWTVRALVRDLAGADAAWHGSGKPEWIEGDAMDRATVLAASCGVQAIVHAVNPPGYRHWERLALPMLENTIAASRARGGARIVLPGTIYNYDPARVAVIDADTPQEPRSRKGIVRVEMERLLARAAPEVPSLIVRAGDFFGPRLRSSWFSQSLVTPGKSLRRLRNPGSGVGHSWAYLPDLAEAIARLMEIEDRLRPFERVQFEGTFDPDGRGVIEAIRRVAGHHVTERAFPWWLMRMLSPFGGFPREVVEIEPYWRHSVRFDNRRLIELLGAEPRTPLDRAVAEALAGLGCIDPGRVPLARAACCAYEPDGSPPSLA